jgi:2'-hydroxyisoflavone reductase
MKLLVIGGSQFVGRAFVEEAVRRGNEVTIFHRGASEPADLPDVDHVHGDQLLSLASLASATRVVSGLGVSRPEQPSCDALPK